MKQRLKAWGDTKVLPIAVTFVFNEDGDLLLLQRHTKDLGGGQWGNPGGRIDDNESPASAARREFFEETGVNPGKIKALGEHKLYLPHGIVHMSSFHAVIPKNSSIKIDPFEHHAYAWFSLENLLNEENIIWGTPSVLRDFGLFKEFDSDPTLADGSSVELIKKL